MLSQIGAQDVVIFSTSCDTKAAANVGLEPEEVAIITGIGCSGRLSGYIKSYGVHAIHGRALPLPKALKWLIKI